MVWSKSCAKPCQSNICGFLCENFYFGKNYLIYLALFGLLLVVVELCQIVTSGPRLPPCLRRKRLRGCTISPTQERDLKLVIDVFTIISYISIIYGCKMDKTVYLYPWFLVQTLMMCMEFIIFMLRLFKSEIVNISRQEVICIIFCALNWIQGMCSIRPKYRVCY